MDLRSIINPDAPSGPRPSSTVPSYGSPDRSSPGQQIPRSYESRSPGQGSFHVKPIPPPLQPPPPHDFRSASASSSFHSSQSPHQYISPSSSLGGNPYPYTQHSPGYGPAHGQRPEVVPLQDKAVPNLTAYITQFQAAQSVRSSTSPTNLEGTHGYEQQHVAVPRASPTLSSGGGQSPSTYHNSSAAFQPHPYPQSRPYHQSQPTTPLGPPVVHPQPQTAYRSEQSNPYQNSPSSATNAYGTFARDTTLPTMAQASHSDSREPRSAGPSDKFNGVDDGIPRAEREYAAHIERERSLSVSPKTKIRRPESIYQDKWSGQVTPAKRKQTHEVADVAEGPSPVLATPSPHDSVNGANLSHSRNLPPGLSIGPGGEGGEHSDRKHSQDQEKDRSAMSPSEPSPPAPTAQSREMSSPGGKDQEQSRSPSHHDTNQQSFTPRSLSGRQSPTAHPSPSDAPAPSAHLSLPPHPNTAAGMRTSSTKRERPGNSAVAAGVSASGQPPPKKRTRHDEPPIFARKASRSTSSSPVVSNRRYPPTNLGPTSAVSGKQELKDAKPAAAPAMDPPSVTKDVNGRSSSLEPNAVALPQPQPPVLDNGPLGPWEPSITNVIPYEEITRIIMDFLFIEVVERKDVGANAAGADLVQGAHLEVEAKLGQLIDKNTNDRVRLPITTECVFNKEDPSWRTTFRSSMTEAQHRTLNQFLNKTVLSSKQQQPSQTHSDDPGASSRPSAKPRIPMDYVHTRERDRFYDLPLSHLPPIPVSVRALINPRHRMRVRVTTDQKSGEKLAQILKIRIADLDIYSPRTAFDWRLSVNLEMSYDGDVSTLTEVVENGRRSERNKDRMTYKHLAYQIDLTQVTMQPEGNSTKAEREHELEIEVSAAKIREQGLLAKAGQTTQYEDLIKGFVDNVRTLSRAVH